MKYPHPFPARMAPELALSALRSLSPCSTVLDPMVGSGTVIREASSLGMRTKGFDLDPLAVLISKITVTPVCLSRVKYLGAELLRNAKKMKTSRKLPWIDKCSETSSYVDYWYANTQKEQLRRMAWQIHFSDYNQSWPNEMDVLRVAVSRIIVTKDSGASLARDVSHSRPHRVKLESDFDVFDAFERSVIKVVRYLECNRPRGGSTLRVGDARKLPWVRNGSIDAIVTSPPYLNAIDYLRGHRLSLVWFGHSIPELRGTRSVSIGAERALPNRLSPDLVELRRAFGDLDDLPGRYQAIVERYLFDLSRMASAFWRVLRPGARMVLVVGDSHLRGVHISNSEAVSAVCSAQGFALTEKRTRELPVQSRYLPISLDAKNALSRRMKKEVVLSFTKPIAKGSSGQV